jgi:hypothetical protein
VTRRATWLLVAATIAIATAADLPVFAGPQPSGESWHAFAGTWSARGQRQSVPIEGGGTASVVYLSGAVVFATRDVLGGGMRAEAIAFDDGSSSGTGRAVWTDSRGNRLFSEIRGRAVAAGRGITGMFTGGTGPFAGASGAYELTWQYVARDNDTANDVQGRAADLRGRLRVGAQR